MKDLTPFVAAAQHGGSPVDLLIALFLIGLIPILAVAVTSFTRIIVVLGLLRSALGTSALPPNIVLTSLAVMLTAAIMAPTLARVNSEAVTPYMARHIPAGVALERGAASIKGFMLRQTGRSELATFARIARIKVSSRAQIPFSVAAPAFMISELRAAFAMGFALVLPFAVIDIVVAAVMMSLGMFMVSPAAISLPLKLLVFVSANGWALVCGALVASFF